MLSALYKETGESVEKKKNGRGGARTPFRPAWRLSPLITHLSGLSSIEIECGLHQGLYDEYTVYQEEKIKCTVHKEKHANRCYAHYVYHVSVTRNCAYTTYVVYIHANC
jgi:hypothetical protein